MKKNKKVLLVSLLSLDVAITLFLFVISLIMIAKLVIYKSTPQAINNSSGLIKYLLQHPTFYGIVFVVPLFLILAANVVALVLYVKKTSAKEETPTKLDDLSEEQKEALRQELLNDLMKDSKKSE